MTVCDEMQKLRDYLDKKGIEWRDKSQGDNEVGIERTHFEIGVTPIYVLSIKGLCATERPLEAYIHYPIQDLTANNVIWLIRKERIKNAFRKNQRVIYCKGDKN